MTGFQRVIKYLAIAFGISICVAIFTGIVNVVSSLIYTFDSINDTGETQIKKFDDSYKYLDIELKTSSLTIKKGDEFSITAGKNLRIVDEKNKVKIVDKSIQLFNKDSKDLTITIPDTMNFKKVSISFGAGKLYVENINANELYMELGAGKATINNVSSDLTNIETGAGDVEIKNSRLNDLDLELGVGNIKVVSEITGSSQIECGIGKLELSLPSSQENYKFEVEKGIGKISLNNETIANNRTIGYGENEIKIEGGIGEIVIKTSER